MRRRLYIAILLLLGLLLAVGGCRKAGTWLVKKDQAEHADVMVLLTGTLADRVLQTADLYHQQVASRVLIVEAGMGGDSLLAERGVHFTSYSQQNRDILVQLGIPADSIVLLPGGATSTRMEAEIVRDYLGAVPGAGSGAVPGDLPGAVPGDLPGGPHSIHSILIVTSAHHTRRACKIFSAAFHPTRRTSEGPVIISCSPSRYTNFHAERWWRSRDDIQKVVTEYLKLFNFILSERRELRQHRPGRE